MRKIAEYDCGELGEMMKAQHRMYGKINKGCYLLHDTRDCCGLDMGDYEEYLRLYPIRTDKQMHYNKFGEYKEDTINQWKMRYANQMTEDFMQDLKYSQIDSPLGITGSIEIDGKRFPINRKIVFSRGETITGLKRRKVYYNEPSIYLAVTACLQADGILDFTMQYIDGHFLMNVYHRRGMNVFGIYKLKDKFVKNYNETKDMINIGAGGHKLDLTKISPNFISRISLRSVDFADVSGYIEREQKREE